MHWGGAEKSSGSISKRTLHKDWFITVVKIDWDFIRGNQSPLKVCATQEMEMREI
jgi:hypothetical protein